MSKKVIPSISEAMFMTNRQGNPLAPIIAQPISPRRMFIPFNPLFANITRNLIPPKSNEEILRERLREQKKRYKNELEDLLLEALKQQSISKLEFSDALNTMKTLSSENAKRFIQSYKSKIEQIQIEKLKELENKSFAIFSKEKQKKQLLKDEIIDLKKKVEVLQNIGTVTPFEIYNNNVNLLDSAITTFNGKTKYTVCLLSNNIVFLVELSTIKEVRQFIYSKFLLQISVKDVNYINEPINLNVNRIRINDLIIFYKRNK